MRPLRDPTHPLLAVTDQLLGDVGMGGKHWLLLEGDGLMKGWVDTELIARHNPQAADAPWRGRAAV